MAPTATPYSGARQNLSRFGGSGVYDRRQRARTGVAVATQQMRGARRNADAGSRQSTRRRLTWCMMRLSLPPPATWLLCDRRGADAAETGVMAHAANHPHKITTVALPRDMDAHHDDDRPQMLCADKPLPWPPPGILPRRLSEAGSIKETDCFGGLFSPSC